VAFKKAQLQQPAITPAAFAEACLGLKLSTHEALLGLQLVGDSTIPGLQAGVRLAWGPSSKVHSCAAAHAAAEAAKAVSKLDVSISGHSIAQLGGTARAPEVPLSAVGLVMDLKQAYKRFVEAYLDPIAADSSLDSSSSSSRGSSAAGSGDCWVSNGSPITLVHLLTLVSASGLVMQGQSWGLHSIADGHQLMQHVMLAARPGKYGHPVAH
jgi:hypothetical protein